MKRFFTISLIGLVLIILFLAANFFRSSSVAAGSLENIDGIPFPLDANRPLVTEKLAHADLYLNHSRFARRLELSITFTPLGLTGLAVGIRDNSFWLSYNKINLCCSEAELAQPNIPLTKLITIPVTDKLADQDGSLDLMFFATYPNSQLTEDEGVYDRTQWLLNNLTIINRPAWPDLSSLRDFIKSSLLRERAL